MPTSTNLELKLLRAIVHLDGTSLVVRVGQCPYVVTANGRVAVGSRPLPKAAIAQLLEDLLTREARDTLHAFGSVQFALPRRPETGSEDFAVIASDRDQPDVIIQRSAKPMSEGGLSVVEAPRSEPRAPTRRSPALVLLIEDSLDQLDLYEMALSDRYRVLGASDGASGVALAAQRQPNVVLVDLDMPGMDGWEVCRRLKSHQQTASIPIMILTANDGEDLEDRAMRIGALELLHKPCAADLLGERIAAVVRRQVA